jgi:hypothetical protein
MIDITITVETKEDKDTILALLEESETNDELPTCSVESKEWFGCDWCGGGRCICN